MILLSSEPLRGGWVALKFPYDPAAVAQVKVVPGARWLRERREWRLPAEAVAGLSSTLRRARIGRLGAAPALREAKPVVDTDIYQHQREGVGFIRTRLDELGGALLADDPGVGKSLQALRALRNSESILILCPAVVVRHWQDEVSRWLGEGSARITSTRKLRWPHEYRIGIASYDTFRSMRQAGRVLVPVARALILDEVHYLSHGRSQRSKAVRDYLKECAEQEIDGVVGLSGTPMMVRPRDLWQPLDLIFPRRFGTFFQFTKRFADGHHEEVPGVDRPIWKCDGASHLEELAERLKPLMLRRTRSEVLDLPPRQRIMLPVEMPLEAIQWRRAAFADLIRDAEAASAAIRSALQNVEEYKLKAATELAESLAAQGRRPLLLTTRRTHARQLGKMLSCPHVTGETPATERRRMLLSGGGPACATMYSVTTGINLTEFNAGIFVGLDWVPSVLLQAEARLLRIGQEREVLYYYLIGIGTVDEQVKSAVLERLTQFSDLIGGAEEDALKGALGAKSEDDLILEIIEMVEKKETT